jgi:hypothetical protein
MRYLGFSGLGNSGSGSRNSGLGLGFYVQHITNKKHLGTEIGVPTGI